MADYKKEELKMGLAPIIDSGTKILILGSFPGEDSLKSGEYYANPLNQFWRILSGLLQEEGFVEANYNEKKKLLLKKGIGLWDVIASCQRKGASDNEIRNPKFNDFDKLFGKYPQKIKVFCNGKKAYDLLSKNYPAGIGSVCLPSSSSSKAMVLNEKKREWCVIRRYL